MTRSRLIGICGRRSELCKFENIHQDLTDKEFAYGFVYHLRNYSQHGGFPLTGTRTGGSWDETWSQLKFSATYSLDYDVIRPHFEGDGKNSKVRRKFGKRIQEHSQGKPFDLKPIIRESLGVLGLCMDQVRELMAVHVSKNEDFVVKLIDRFTTAHPGTSVVGLSVMPVDERDSVRDKANIIPVRDESVIRARQFREKNNAQTLSVENRIISSE